MSEEILRALMELFAIIIKQDGGLSEKEKEYVRKFLVQQIGIESADAYFSLFLQNATDEKVTEDDGQKKKKLTSVLDSVKTLRIGKKISKTLNQRQKIVVLVRALELIYTEYNLTDQRLGIVETIADVFKVNKDEYNSIMRFIKAAEDKDLNDPNLLVIHPGVPPEGSTHAIQAEGLDELIILLRVPSVELYFMNYCGTLEVLLNGHHLQSRSIYLLANGSSIRLPVGVPIYYSDITSVFLSPGNKDKIILEADDLCYKFPGNVTGLEKISFIADQGNLVGIMGASGSGKTTLLNVLSGMYNPSSGSVRINGIDLFRDKEQLRGVIGYVPQDDLLVEELTVFENLFYSAKFCFRDLDNDEIKKKVIEMLDTLGLLRKKDLKVGSVMNKTISGGQRKRLNIALELIREPAVLFLDEPTSGLSSRDSENVMDLLRELAIKGKLIFNVIHQPSSELYKMFDMVIVLDEGGRMIYFGNPVEAVIHFKKIDNQVNYGAGECPVCGNINPEQIFSIVEARQVDEFGNYTSRRKISAQKWRQFFESERTVKERKQEAEKPPSKLNVPGWFGQFVNYLKRDFKAKISNRQYLGLVLGVSPILAIILSYIIRYIADPTSHTYVFRENENIPIYIFMAIIVALFLGLIMSAEEIYRDRKILKREKFLHLSHSSYLIAKISNITLMAAMQTIIFVLIANTVLGIYGMTFHYWFALFSVAVCANFIGLIISSAFNSAVTIYIIIPLVMIPMMVLSGAMFSFEKLNRSITSVNKVPLIAEAMPTKWAFEALMVRQFKNNRFEENFFEIEREISRTNFQSAYYIPALEERLSLVMDEFEEKGRIRETQQELLVLKNEILRQQDSIGVSTFNRETFNPGNFTDQTYSEITAFFSELNDYYLEQFSKANRIKQDMLNQIMEEHRELYYSLLDKYHNESVSDHVKKIYEKNKIIESDGRLYQQTDPVFLYPESFRSHFYAPVKKAFGTYIDTYWFNIVFIWLISLLLYVILYFDLLHKLISSSLFK
ncbi:MAG: ATP-binding cassette domain-containing protein [Bacteroidales bacterium]|nr:ATP-binding cassette domain-containing protein [Bacteroidales bacterium]